jgi:hypothetical protein
MNGLEAVQAFEAAERQYDVIIMGRSTLFLVLAALLLTFACRHLDACHGWDESRTGD